MGIGVSKVSLFFLHTESIVSLAQRNYENLFGGVIVIAVCLVGLIDVYRCLRKSDQSLEC